MESSFLQPSSPLRRPRDRRRGGVWLEGGWACRGVGCGRSHGDPATERLTVRGSLLPPLPPPNSSLQPRLQDRPFQASRCPCGNLQGRAAKTGAPRPTFPRQGAPARALPPDAVLGPRRSAPRPRARSPPCLRRPCLRPRLGARPPRKPVGRPGGRGAAAPRSPPAGRRGPSARGAGRGRAGRAGPAGPGVSDVTPCAHLGWGAGERTTEMRRPPRS